MLDLEKTLENLDINADWIGLRQVYETTTHRIFRDGKPQSNGRKINHGVMVEVMVNGQIGYCATNYLNQSAIQQAAEIAQQQAEKASKWSIFKFNTDIRPPAKGSYQSPITESANLVHPQELNDLLVQICHRLRVSDKVVKATAMAGISDISSHFVSSNGANIQQQFSLVETDYAAIAQDGNIIQKRSDNGMLARCYQAGKEVFNPEITLNRVQQIGEEAVELVFAQDCPNMTTTLVLAPDQMMLQIHESVGHPLEIDRILGDERNYAGSSFVKLSDFGTLAYGSPLMNITFDPTVKGEFASYGYDDAGLKAEKQYLIKDGILLRGLGSLESQQRSNIQGVANFRSSSWNRPSIDRMANLNLESGNSSFHEIISAIEFGVYMKSNRSWSIDDYRNKFQFGCEYAQLIENGKITKTLRNPNYRGVTQHFWHNLIYVGNESTREFYGTPYCGKGEPNQAIRVGHASPVCAFKDIQVFGC
ncbi:TldD/PmbA family protein [Cyanobacterium aponinum UTEX 3221]|uniref:TldD/PmbA family protein n=1 Tax=Cyanobacterium aponinum TaxID=379064 RepID=UPI002B4BCB8D|nr:TldD/PmbA family protein [Cyanobacterium aponinum]WRL36994.1 TldD/PmbA family protein [Cyanobacterium aponinum UTEX 3221]